MFTRHIARIIRDHPFALGTALLCAAAVLSVGVLVLCLCRVVEGRPRPTGGPMIRQICRAALIIYCVILLASIAVMVWAYLAAEEALPGMAELEWRAKR